MAPAPALAKRARSSRRHPLDQATLHAALHRRGGSASSSATASAPSSSTSPTTSPASLHATPGQVGRSEPALRRASWPTSIGARARSSRRSTGSASPRTPSMIGTSDNGPWFQEGGARGLRGRKGQSPSRSGQRRALPRALAGRHPRAGSRRQTQSRPASTCCRTLLALAGVPRSPRDPHDRRRRPRAVLHRARTGPRAAFFSTPTRAPRGAARALEDASSARHRLPGAHRLPFAPLFPQVHGSSTSRATPTSRTMSTSAPTRSSSSSAAWPRRTREARAKPRAGWK